MLKLVVERVADGISNMVEFQDMPDLERAKSLLLEFASVPDSAAKSILTHDQLRDTLFYAANVSDSFKYFELFQAKYLTSKILGKSHDNVRLSFQFRVFVPLPNLLLQLILYLIRDSIFTTQRIFEYHFDRKYLQWETLDELDSALTECINSKQPLQDDLQETLLSIQKRPIVSDLQRRTYNIAREKDGQPLVHRICNMGLLTQPMLTRIDELFVEHLQDAADEMGWDTPRWSNALDAYVEAVADYFDDLENERDAVGENPLPERSIQRAVAAKFRILYTKTHGGPRPLPLPTSSMLYAVAKLGEKFGLSIAEVSTSPSTLFQIVLLIFFSGRSMARCTRQLRR